MPTGQSVIMWRLALSSSHGQKWCQMQRDGSWRRRTCEWPPCSRC